MKHIPLLALAFTALTFSLAACGDKDENDDNGDGQLLCKEAKLVSCEDAAILELDLQNSIAPGLFTNTVEGSDWLTVVDATAGGFNANPPHAYVYGRFTANGLEKVSLTDEAALASMDWDIAFRRYVARINSGDSGPSCVQAALLANTTYGAVTSANTAAIYRDDDWLTDSCDFVNDGTGLPGAPASAISGYWSYPGCVSMTGNVYQLQLRDGRVLKLTVEAYYLPNVQAECQADDVTTTTPTGSGTVRLRWAFLGD